MSEKRTKQLIIRVSPTEFETLTRQKTHPNLARYIRERVLEDGKASDKKRQIPIPARSRAGTCRNG